MKSLAAQFAGAFLGMLVGVVVLSQPNSGPVPIRYVAMADANCGNGGPCTASGISTGGSQTGADPGGGLCLSATVINLCGTITGGISLSAATPLTLSNTTSSTIAVSATGANNALTINNTGSASGQLFQLQQGGVNRFTVSGGGDVSVSNRHLLMGNGGSPCATGAATATCAFAAKLTAAATSNCSGGGTGVCLTFTAAFTSIPICVFTDRSTAANITATTASTTQAGATATAADVIDIICIGNNT
jgi:hypothetical protein